MLILGIVLFYFIWNGLVDKHSESQRKDRWFRQTNGKVPYNEWSDVS